MHFLVIANVEYEITNNIQGEIIGVVLVVVTPAQSTPLTLHEFALTFRTAEAEIFVMQLN
jgi:hypothetical protein